MDAIALSTPPTYTLAQINTWVAQKEGIYGPLVDMGHNGQQSVFSFDQDTDPPAKNAIITLMSAPAPANAQSIVDNEEIMVAGTLTACRASR